MYPAFYAVRASHLEEESYRNDIVSIAFAFNWTPDTIDNLKVTEYLFWVSAAEKIMKVKLGGV